MDLDKESRPEARSSLAPSFPQKNANFGYQLELRALRMETASVLTTAAGKEKGTLCSVLQHRLFTGWGDERLRPVGLVKDLDWRLGLFTARLQHTTCRGLTF